MAATGFDNLRVSQDIKAAGFNEAQAGSIVRSMVAAFQDGMIAAKADIANLRAEVFPRLHRLRLAAAHTGRLRADAVGESALFGEISRDLGARWRLAAGGRWFGYRIRTGSLTEFPNTPMYNSPFTDFESNDRGMLFKASLSDGSNLQDMDLGGCRQWEPTPRR